MNTKKVVSLGDGEDPLSTSSTPFIKKVAPKNVFERVIQEQEKDLLGGADKKHGFVVNKNTQVHMGAKDVAGVQSNKVVTNPFKQSAKVLAASQPEPIQPREVIFPSQNQIQNQSKKQTEREPSPSRKPFDNPKVQAVLKTVEEKEKVSPPKPKPVAPQKDAIKLTNVDLVPGEKPLVSVSCFISLMQYPHLSTDGVLIITNYQVIFRPSDEAYFNKKPKLKKDYLNVPLSFVFKFDKATDKKNPDVVYIDLHSKDGRVFRLRLAERHGLEIMQYLHVYAFPERKDHFFAVEYGRANKELEDRFKGWQIYDIEKEFKRQGCEFALSSEPDSGANHTFRIIENKDFRICSTYPPKLLVPAKISDSAFYASSRFRTKERVPAVTYYYAKTKTILSRSSQSKPGLYQSRCLEDEQLLRYLGNPHLNDIGDTGVTDVNLYIYDARPYLNAMANRVNGKGFEDTKWYRNCEIFFMDIDNIHHVRDSHRKLLNLCHSPDLSNLKWYSQLESSNWLELMSYIIGAAIKVASSLRNGKNCLVHCSDGWDRTAQILSLAQIMLDPYFRTIEGFEVLIMKDWVYFGHQFNMRMGHGNKNEKDDQKAPVFLQFLDCIHQLIHQYPFAFEFNQKFLTDLAYHAYSCKFGLFLCNNYKEVVEHRMEEKTVSIWSYLNAQKEKYFNIYYNKGENLSSPLILKPSHHLKHLRLWEEHFLNYSWLSKPQYELMESIAFPTDFFEHMLMKDRKKVRELKAEVDELKAKLKQYERKTSKDEGNGSPNSEAKINEGEERITRDTKQEEEKQENDVVKQKKKKDKWQYKEGPAPELTHSETIQTFENDQIPREENGNQGDLNAELVRDPEVQETSAAEQKEENDEDRVSGEDDAKNESADQKIHEGEQKEVQVEGKEAPEEHREVNDKQEQNTASINAISEQKEGQSEESKVPEETKVIEEAQGEKANLEEEKKEIKDLQNEMNGRENLIVENIVKEEQALNNEGNPEQESRESVDL